MKARKDVKGLLRVASRDRQLWETIIQALRDLGEEAYDALCNILRDPMSYEGDRCYSAWALGESGDPRAVEVLLDVFKDVKTDGHLRLLTAHVISALGRTRDPKAVEPLCQILWSLYPPLLSTAVNALGEIGDPRAIEALSNVVRNTDDGPCSDAIQALAQIGIDTAKETLRNFASNDSRDFVRELATEALKKLEANRVPPRRPSMNQQELDIKQIYEMAWKVLNRLGKALRDAEGIWGLEYTRRAHTYLSFGWLLV